MEQIYHIGDCPLCKGYGMMEVLYDFSSEKCFVMCDECLLEFNSINDYKNNTNGHRVTLGNNTAPSARAATLEEIKSSEWYPFVIKQLPICL